MTRWINCSQLGKKKEVEFSNLLISSFGGEVVRASKEQDMYYHIDIIWKYKGKEYSFDIKSAKKESRTDNNPNYKINWIELQNVRGNSGWLYGKADYIAFECEHDWIICRRIDIIKFIDNTVKDKRISKSKDLYTYYQRDGRQDIVVKVLSDDLRKIARQIFSKVVK